MRHMPRPVLVQTMVILCYLSIASSRRLYSSQNHHYLVSFAACFASQAVRRTGAFQQQTPVHSTRNRRDFSPEPPYSSRFLNQIEETIHNVLAKYQENDNILQLPPEEREAVGVARNLRKRISALTRNKDCRRCWLQQKHCYCRNCPPVQPPSDINRLFVLVHHKEICLAVDTARLILSSFPATCRLVLGGIGPEYQASMAEMIEAMMNPKCLVLFPTDDAVSFADLEQEMRHEQEDEAENSMGDKHGWDVIVVDGTWSQARKLYKRYIPIEQDGGPATVKLNDEALEFLSATTSDSYDTQNDGFTRLPGHQLRRHPIQWKAISTLEATRLLMNDMSLPHVEKASCRSRPWDVLSTYQQTADTATRTQLGPHR